MNRFSGLLLGALLACAAPALARDIVIEDFDAQIEVRSDSTLLVTETIRVQFIGQWNGIFRNIPYRYHPMGQRGFTVPLIVQSVHDDQGKPLRRWISRKAGDIMVKIKVPEARDAVRTVVIVYEVGDVIRSYGQPDYGVSDEVYWNVTGNNWQFPILRSRARVHLPSGVGREEVRQISYTGRYGSTQTQATARWAGDELVFDNQYPLNPGEGLTIAVQFPTGRLHAPSLAKRIGWFLHDQWLAVFPLLVLAGFFWMWYTRGRDPIRGRSVIPEFEPPERLSPAGVGLLADDRLDRRDISATIVDLAVRGYIHLRQEEDDDFTLDLLRPDYRGDLSLKPHERDALLGLFGGGTHTTLSRLKHNFYTEVPIMRDDLASMLIKAGYYTARPSVTRSGALTIAFMAAGAAVALGVWRQTPAAYFVITVICALASLIFAYHMPWKTRRGVRVLAKVKGLEEYLVRGERDRMQAMTVENWERLLPYAMALGVADRWAEQFRHIYAEPPKWIDTRGDVWSGPVLVGRLDTFERRAARDLFAAPRSAGGSGGGWSGGSGFGGGGGFSGGGFGGGGGGGW